MMRPRSSSVSRPNTSDGIPKHAAVGQAARNCRTMMVSSASPYADRSRQMGATNRAIIGSGNMTSPSACSPWQHPNPLGRIGLAVGKFMVVAHADRRNRPVSRGNERKDCLRTVLAPTTSPQCHGTSQRGDSNPAITSPTGRWLHLRARLLQTGVPRGGRGLVEMSAWARNNLSHLTDAEIAALSANCHSEAASSRRMSAGFDQPANPNEPDGRQRQRRFTGSDASQMVTAPSATSWPRVRRSTLGLIPPRR